MWPLTWRSSSCSLSFAKLHNGGGFPACEAQTQVYIARALLSHKQRGPRQNTFPPFWLLFILAKDLVVVRLECLLEGCAFLLCGALLANIPGATVDVDGPESEHDSSQRKPKR